jgi:hypothetical protein
VSGDRTPKQRAADDALAAAIEQAARTYGSIESTTVITNWAVLGTGLGADGEGDLYPDFILLPNNGRGVSHNQLIGLIRAAQIRVEKSYMEPDD